MGNYYLEIDPWTYIVDISGDNSYCMIGLVINSDDYWLLGDVLLRNYYTIFNEQDKQIGFVPHKTSNATITSGDAPP